MIDVVINYDKTSQEYKVYEPSTDTLLITTNLGESFSRLSEFLKSNNMISNDILTSDDITYHIDSATFFALIESNINLLKRLNSAPSGFTISTQKFGGSGQNQKKESNKKDYRNERSNRFGGTFSKSSFNQSYKKFGK